MTTDDQRCTSAREWLSSFRDGEADDDSRAEAHLGACAACSAWSERFDLVTRQVRFRSPQAPPAVTASIDALPFNPAAAPLLRFGRALLWVAAAFGVVAVALGLAGVAGHAHLGSSDGRQAEAMTLALIGGFALTAWRPARMAMGLLPVAAFAAAITMGLSALELSAGRAELVEEVWHLPLFLGAIGAALVVKAVPSITSSAVLPARHAVPHGT